jgi:hypothetical protein
MEEIHADEVNAMNEAAGFDRTFCCQSLGSGPSVARACRAKRLSCGRHRRFKDVPGDLGEVHTPTN